LDSAKLSSLTAVIRHTKISTCFEACRILFVVQNEANNDVICAVRTWLLEQDSA